MVVAIPAALCHFLSNPLKGAIFAEEVFDNVAIPVRATFEFFAKIIWRFLAVLVVQPDDVMHVMVVHNKPPRLFRYLALRILHIPRDFSYFKKYRPHVTGEVGEVCGVGFTHFFLPFLATSAALNSLATLVGMPTFLANAGL